MSVNIQGSQGWSDVNHQCEPLNGLSVLVSVLVQAWSQCNLPRPDFISKYHTISQQGIVTWVFYN